MRYILFILALLMLAVPGLSQDEQFPLGECDEESLSFLTETLTELTQTISDGDPDAVRQAVVTMQVLLSTYRVRCDGLVFTAEEYGADWVSDVIFLPDGSHRVTVESTAVVSVNVEGVDGDCGFSNLIQVTGFDFNAEEPELRSSQDLWQFEDCAGIITVDSPEPGWTITIEPLLP